MTSEYGKKSDKLRKLQSTQYRWVKLAWSSFPYKYSLCHAQNNNMSVQTTNSWFL